VLLSFSILLFNIKSGYFIQNCSLKNEEIAFKKKGKKKSRAPMQVIFSFLKNNIRRKWNKAKGVSQERVQLQHFPLNNAATMSNIYTPASLPKEVRFFL